MNDNKNQLGVIASQLVCLSLNEKEESSLGKIVSSLGKCITNYQAQRLNALGLSYEVLCNLRSSYKDGVEFSEVLFSEEQGCTRKTSKAC